VPDELGVCVWSRREQRIELARVGHKRLELRKRL
jgi:hypothetical protein